MEDKVWLYRFDRETGLSVEPCDLSDNYEYNKRLRRLCRGNGNTILVDRLQGFIYNNTLWLKERNDEYAMDIFIKDEVNKLSDLKEEVKKHKKFVKLMKRGVKYDDK